MSRAHRRAEVRRFLSDGNIYGTTEIANALGWHPSTTRSVLDKMPDLKLIGRGQWQLKEEAQR